MRKTKQSRDPAANAVAGRAKDDFDNAVEELRDIAVQELRVSVQHAVGIRNLLLITGDPPKMGPYPDATAVFDIDAIGLTNMLNKLNHGLEIGTNPIGEPTAFCIGVGESGGDQS